ncbi:MAG TPA: DivIVA domain-containing protein, partial [Acidimicrobiales bacterium]|nr:DivIVA domain-containing protein [Acidimicrobiales bacterium]
QGTPRPRFAVRMRGFDRDQVDAYLNDRARWADQAWGRIRDLEVRLSEQEGTDSPQRVREEADRTVEEASRTLDRFAQEVNAKATELEQAVLRQVQPQVDELRVHVEDLEEQRRTALAELGQRRESLNGLVRRLYGDGERPSGPNGARAGANGDHPSPR